MVRNLYGSFVQIPCNLNTKIKGIYCDAMKVMMYKGLWALVKINQHFQS